MEKKYEEDRPYLPADVERAVKVEAGHKCSIQHCHEHTYLETHHIDQNRENNTLVNLILLCDKHHKMAHADKIDKKALREYKKLLNSNSYNYQEIISDYFEFYKKLVDFITKELYLTQWNFISDNLITYHINQKIIDGYENFTLRVAKTNFPKIKVDLENSILELNENFTNLMEHYLKCAYQIYYETDNIIWSEDMRWKQEWLPQKEYDRRYSEVEKWRNQLFIYHCNLTVSLNKFAGYPLKTGQPAISKS